MTSQWVFSYADQLAVANADHAWYAIHLAIAGLVVWLCVATICRTVQKCKELEWEDVDDNNDNPEKLR